MDHRHYEISCPCGHRTQAVAGQGIADPLLGGIELSEWRLVGPGLAALIVALALRFRLSRARIQEFLAEWLGLELSIGTIHQTIHEASAAVAPAEEALVAAVLASDLLHADETSWPEARQTLWLSAAGALAGVFVSARAAGERCLDRLFDSGLRYSRQPCSQSTGRLT